VDANGRTPDRSTKPARELDEKARKIRENPYKTPPNHLTTKDDAPLHGVGSHGANATVEFVESERDDGGK